MRSSNNDDEICLVGGTLFDVLALYKKEKIFNNDLAIGLLKVSGQNVPYDRKDPKLTTQVSNLRWCKRNSFQKDFYPGHIIRRLKGREFGSACSRVKDFSDKCINEEERKSVVAALKFMIEHDSSISDEETFVVDDNGNKRTRRQVFDQMGFSYIPFLTSVIIYAFSRTDTLGARTVAQWVVSEGERDRIVAPDFGEEYRDSIFFNEDINTYSKVDEIDDDDVAEPISKEEVEDDFYRGMYHYSDKRFDTIFIETKVREYDYYDRSKNFNFFHLNVLETNEFDVSELVKYLQNNLAQYLYSQAECRGMIDDKSITMAGHNALKMISKLTNRKFVLPDKALGEMLISIFLEVKGNAHKIMSKVQIVKDAQLSDSKTDGIHLGKDGTIYFASSCVDGDLLKAVDSAFDKILAIRENCDDELMMVKAEAFKMLEDKNDIRILKDAIVPKPGVGVSMKKGYGIFLGYDIALRTATDDDDYLQMVKTKIVNDAEICYAHVRELVSKHNLWKEKITFFLLPFNDAEKDVEDVFKKVIEA